MTKHALPALLTVLALIAGCQSSTQQADSDTVPPPSVNVERVAEVRALYQQVNPNTRVGYVNAMLPSDELVSVVDVPTEDFRNGDAITFVDLQQNPIASGRVVNVLPDAVHVRYTATERAPVVGDIAVKFVR